MSHICRSFGLPMKDPYPFKNSILPSYLLKLNAHEGRTGRIPLLQRKTGQGLLGYFGVVQTWKTSQGRGPPRR